MTDDATPTTRAAPDLVAAATVVMERLAVTASDTVSIICNPDPAETPELVGVVADAARERTGRVGCANTQPVNATARNPQTRSPQRCARQPSSCC